MAAKPYDVLIIGGGMVGASLAVALMPLKLKIGMVDAFEFGEAKQPGYDDRSIALSYGSSLIFKGMGLWDALQPNTTAIDQIHISDRGHFGAARLTAKKENVPALGYLVESRVLGRLLYDKLAKQTKKAGKVDLIVPAELNAIQTLEGGLEISLVKQDKNIRLQTKLLLAADGTQSKTRQLSGIGSRRDDYHQSAVIANVSTEKPHKNQAFERFTDTGPIALLPLSDNRCSLVWTHDTQQGTGDLDDTLSLDDAAFLEKLGKAFGYRLGRFTKVGKRSSFPLSLVVAQKNTAPRTVIVGNASHTMHPVAGQGLNLALRDIAELADLIAENRHDAGSESLLQAYEEKRKGDLKTTIRYTDSLVRLFSNDNLLLGHARAAGLLAVDRFAPLRKWITRQSMGINYRQSRLARGLSLRTNP
jgi:2-octaprenyl-6-methoxyphenol hydroxylase